MVSATLFGSKSLTWPAIRTGKVEASKVFRALTPLRPSARPFQVSAALLPSGVTAPTPVMATRLIGFTGVPGCIRFIGDHRRPVPG